VTISPRVWESFETALELSGGTAVVSDMDDPKAEELLFSANFACPICGYSMRELEPRLFSFNNPAGACPTCDGLGVQQYFDPDRVIQNPELSLAGGAIRGWDKRNFYYFQMLKSLAEHYKFDVEAPWASLSPNVHKVILFGSGKENIEFKYMNDRGDTSVRRHPFEGVLHNGAPLQRDRIQRGARRAGEVHQQPLLRHLRRHASASRSAPRVCGKHGADHLRHEHRPRDGLLQQPEALRPARENRRKSAERDWRSPEVPGERRPELPDAFPLGRNALRR
jgi:excinuclease ABC subunit A